jgi:Protein of unknown function (DUF2771)
VRRRVRILVVLAALAATTLLAACNKPLPNVTILSGSTTIVARPQTYCFDGNSKQCHNPQQRTPQISARQGATLFIDVPRAVADHSWTAASVNLRSGKYQAIAGDGLASGLVHGNHSTRLAVPYGSGTYYVLITQVSGDVGIWVAEVKITS